MTAVSVQINCAAEATQQASEYNTACQFVMFNLNKGLSVFEELYLFCLKLVIFDLNN